MFCVKCNSEISDNAKFCAICGEPVKKLNFCQKCGNKLAENSKFCISCGARVEEAAASVQTASPAVQNAAAAVEAEKTAEAVNASVSEANAASAPVSLGKPSEQKPSDFVSPSVPRPVYSDSAPKSTAAPSFSGQTASSPDSGYIPPYNPPQTSGNAQTPTVVSNAPAAAAVVKKRSKKPVIIISIVAVLVVALAACTVLYFTNSALVLSTVMGKSNYAAMVEGNSIRQATALLDTSTVSGGIKTATGFYHTLGTLDPDGNGEGLIFKLSDTASGSSDVQYVNLSSFFAALNSSVKDTYGVNSVVVSLGMNAELTDTARAELKNKLYIDNNQIDEILEYINGSKISAGITTGESSAAFKAGMEIKDFKVDLKVLINSKGEAYVVLPFASEKAIMVKVGEAIEGGVEFSDSDESVLLELDDKEIERLISEIVEVYIESYKNAEIEMENGDLSVSGVSVSGKVLTAEFDSDMIEKLIADIGKIIAKDDYFKGKIVEYLKECGVDITESGYEEAIIDATSEIEADDSLKLKITTVINNSGTVLGKSYQISAKNSKIKFSYAEAGGELAFEFKTETAAASGSSDSKKISNSLSLKLETENETDGTATFKIASNGQNLTFKVKYKDAKIEKFCGKDIPVGTYEISVSLPKDFTEENATQANYSEFLVDSKLILSSKIDGDTCTVSVGVSSDKLGKVSLIYSLTAQNSTTDLNVPSSVMDLSPYIDGDEPDDEFKKEFIEYLESIRDAISNQNAGDIGDSAADAIDEIISSANKASSAEISELRNSISTGASEVLNFSTKYDVHDNGLYNEVLALYGEYYDLYLDFTDVYYDNYSLTSEEYSGFKSRLDTLDVKKNALEELYKQAQADNPAA